MDERPFGWPVMGYPSPQGPYYCGVGTQFVSAYKFPKLNFILFKRKALLTGIWTTSSSSSFESLFICWYKNLWQQWRTYGITGERNENVAILQKIIKI